MLAKCNLYFHYYFYTSQVANGIFLHFCSFTNQQQLMNLLTSFPWRTQGWFVHLEGLYESAN